MVFLPNMYFKSGKCLILRVYSHVCHHLRKKKQTLNKIMLIFHSEIFHNKIKMLDLKKL